MLPTDSPVERSDERAAIPADANANALAIRPRLRSGLRFEARTEDGAQVVIIEDTVRNKFFQIGELEFTLLSQLNGKRSLEAAVENWQRQWPHMELQASDAVLIVQWLAGTNLLAAGPEAQAARLSQSVARQSYWKSLSRWNLLCVKCKLFHPEPLLKLFEKPARLLFSPVGFAVWLLLVVTGLFSISGGWESVFSHTHEVLSNYRWLWLLVLWIGLKVIHEAGHALACKRYRVPVSDAGVLLILFAPLAYVDVTASWRLPSRWQRMVIAAAGMYFELAVAAIASIVWYFYPEGLVADICQQTILLASLTTLIVNANPLMRFDGYYLLADGLGIVNLYGKGSQWLSDYWQQRVWGLSPTASTLSGWRLTVVALYGVGAFIWRVLLTLGILIVASTLFDGAGLILALVGGLFWFGVPIWRQAKQLVSKVSRQPGSRWVRARRPLIAASILLGLAAWLFVIPAPHCVPGIVEYKDEVILRAGYDGFLQRVIVEDGQPVRAGDVLAELINPRLDVELASLESRIEASRLTIRMLQSGADVAEAQAESENLRGLLEQLAEKAAWRDGQQLVAPVDGVVIARHLDHRLGTMFKQGDPILSIIQPHQLEIVLSLDQVQADALRAPGKLHFDFRLTGFRRLPATVCTVSAKASDLLPHPALGVDYGGSLPVQFVHSSTSTQNNPQQARLLAPRFTARLSAIAEHASMATAGERGFLQLHSHSYSRGWQWIFTARQWVAEKLGKTRN